MLFRVLAVLCALPPLVIPFMGNPGSPDGTVRLLEWFFPVFVVVAVVCAWKSYNERPEIAWILLAVLIASEAGMFYLLQTS